MIRIVYKKMLKSRISEEIVGEDEKSIALIERIQEAIITYRKAYSGENMNVEKVMEIFHARGQRD